MAFEKKFELKLYVPVTWEVAGDMPDKWADGLKVNAERMNDRRQAKIPDDGTFINTLATPATKAYRGLLNPDFVSKSGRIAGDISNAHAKNIGTAFNFWNDKINKAFETKDGVVAKEFKEKVDAAKVKWALRVADKTIRLTGDKIRGRGVTPIATYYLVGDKRATSWIQQGDIADGEPYNITTETERTAVKAAVQQRLVQGGMMVINSEYQPSVVDEQNVINAALLTKLRETTLCDEFVDTPAPDKCYCVWALDDNLLYLHVQVGLTV